MNRRSWSAIIAAATLVLAACTTAEVADAIMITGFDAKGEPLPEVFSYAPDAPEFICLAAVLRAPPETKITFVWVYKTQDIEIDRAEVIEVEHKLGLDGKDQIERYGIAAFNEQCRKSVFAYLDEWTEFTRKLGFWLDLDDPYITFKNEYIESVWWILRQFWDQDMLYQGHKIVPYCPRCGTSLSSHEDSQGYADVQDPSIFIKLKLVDEDASFLVWTTTPWTLISNGALAVGPDHDYVRVRNKGEVLILAEALLGVLDGDKEILGTVKGSELVGKRYEPCFPFFKDAPGPFRVIATSFVSPPLTA